MMRTMCEHGTTVLLPIGGRVCDIDACLVPIVAALNAGGVPTKGCCCGHGKVAPSIILDDGRWLVVMSRVEALAFYGEPDALPRPASAQHEPSFPGAETVVMSMRDPHLVVHQSSARCATQEPHTVESCGEFTPRTEDIVHALECSIEEAEIWVEKFEYNESKDPNSPEAAAQSRRDAEVLRWLLSKYAAVRSPETTVADPWGYGDDR